MANLEKIAEDLSSLTVLEASELTKILEEKWGVTAAAPVAAVAAPSAQGGDAGGAADASVYRNNMKADKYSASAAISGLTQGLRDQAANTKKKS